MDLRSLDRKVSSLEGRRDEAIRSFSSLEEDLLELSQNIELLTKVEQTLLHISTKVLGQSTKNIDKLVTVGLHLVFDDQNLEFRTNTEKYRGKTAIKFQLLENGRSAPLMDAYGGGVLVIVGVLLQTFTTMSLGMRRLLFLDETLAHLSEQYIDNASRLLKKLCDELDFTIIMVTHQPEFAAHATVAYKAFARGGETVFHKTH